MTVAIVKYNAGNICSVTNALNRLGVGAVVTDDESELRSAEKVVFPGVGEASSAMEYLRERNLDSVIRSLTQPVLAICLGMQLLCESSEEGETRCLELLPYRVRKFAGGLNKVPHVGWNNIFELRSPLFEGVKEHSFVYFVHGYYVESGSESTATCDYGETFTAAVQHRNFYAVQFHPEKSGSVGETILQNFLNL